MHSSVLCAGWIGLFAFVGPGEGYQRSNLPCILKGEREVLWQNLLSSPQRHCSIPLASLVLLECTFDVTLKSLKQFRWCGGTSTTVAMKLEVGGGVVVDENTTWGGRKEPRNLSESLCVPQPHSSLLQPQPIPFWSIASLARARTPRH